MKEREKEILEARRFTQQMHNAVLRAESDEDREFWEGVEQDARRMEREVIERNF